MEFWNWIVNYVKNSLGLNLIEENPANAQGWFNLVFSCLSLLIGVLVFYRTIYAILGIFGKSRKYSAKPMDKRYAFVLSARNEEKVIGNLIDSIHQQTYPQNLIDIFVVADNCDDNTAAVARKLGCHVYERHDLEHCRKGYALNFLFSHLKEDIDIESYYGYCFMDSDNICAPTFLENMNNALQDGYGVMSGYRNVKNLTENWIAAVSGVNMYRVVIFGQRPRSIVDSAEQICGTGFIMRGYLLKDGWPSTGLTEDAETMTRLVGQNVPMGYNEAAEFYDEQPSNVKIAIRQRLRWAKGGILNWWEHGWGLFVSWLKKPTWSKYDLYWEIFPYGLVTFAFTFLQQILSLSYLLYMGVNTNTGYTLMDFFIYPLNTMLYMYIGGFLTGIIVLIKEWKKIHFNFGQALGYAFLWPLYDMLGVPISILCLFMRVGWKPIPHHVVADANSLVEEEAKKSAKKK
jgi:cellulose synthase/poly-beta-1,6-N-acetylglucosamine synthase-like glycosyltransferase